MAGKADVTEMEVACTPAHSLTHLHILAHMLARTPRTHVNAPELQELRQALPEVASQHVEDFKAELYEGKHVRSAAFLFASSF